MSHVTSVKTRDGLYGWLFTLFAIGFIIFFSFFSQHINADTLDKDINKAFTNQNLEVASYKLTHMKPATLGDHKAFALDEETKKNGWYMTFYHLFKSDLSLGHIKLYDVITKDGNHYLAEVNRHHFIRQFHQTQN